MLSVVIFAGGFGERLWPASKPTFPKQFMTLKGGLSFFQQSLQRAAMLTCVERTYVQDELPILVITRKSILSETIKQCTDFAASLNVDMRRSFLKNCLLFLNRYHGILRRLLLLRLCTCRSYAVKPGYRSPPFFRLPVIM